MDRSDPTTVQAFVRSERSVSLMADHVVALFKTTADASTAVDKLVAAGISDKRISVLMGDSFRGEHFGIEDATKAPEGATTGGLVGGTLGAIAGSLVAVGSLALPGVGIVLAGSGVVHRWSA